jgi:hypothetical protein
LREADREIRLRAGAGTGQGKQDRKAGRHEETWDKGRGGSLTFGL